MTHRINFNWTLEPSVLLVVRIVASVRCDRWHFLSGSYLPQSDFSSELMSVHYNSEHINTALRYGLAGAVGDAVTLGHDFTLARWYDVSPIRIYADAEDPGVMFPRTIGVDQSQSRAVGYESIELGIRVVGLEHVKARPRYRVQRVSGLRWIVETLYEQNNGR